MAAEVRIQEAEIQEAQQRWQEAIRDAPQRRPRFETPSGIPLKPLYTPADVEVDYLQDLGFPGEFPFARGIYRTMYRGRLWTMRQYAGYATAEESNRRYRYLLAQGQTGLSVAFDLPTQLGYDADHPTAHGEVGRVGVSICSLEDMRRLLDGIPLDRVSLSMTINAPAAILLAMVLALAREQNVDWKQLRGTVQNDILKEYVARGLYIFPPEPSMRLTVDVIAFCYRHVRNWNPISISGYHIREAGATAVQEVAFTFAHALEYMRAAARAGFSIDDIGPQISFFFNAHNHFLEEVAKFRAARRLWARLARERLGANRPEAMMLRFHVQTGGSTLTAQQPENNIIRVTIQALAAIIGGCQSLHTNAMDEALWLPTEKSARVALRTQQILAYESGVADTIDPLAGSYVIEHLTAEIERRAREEIDHIEALGGALRAIETGYIQRAIAESAYQAQKAVESGEQIIVGVNAFQVEEEHPELERLKVDPAIEEAQRARLQTLRARRDGEQISALLSRIEEAARRPEEPLMPLFVEAVAADATLGEICSVLRRVWGEYRPPEIL
jgi:methylmalonyl-CoA mutase N-terminal domain/subunit